MLYTTGTRWQQSSDSMEIGFQGGEIRKITNSNERVIRLIPWRIEWESWFPGKSWGIWDGANCGDFVTSVINVDVLNNSKENVHVHFIIYSCSYISSIFNPNAFDLVSGLINKTFLLLYLNTNMYRDTLLWNKLVINYEMHRRHLRRN